MFCYIHSFFVLDCTYKWHHTVFVFLWLLSLSIIPSTFIHVVANDNTSYLFLWLSSICIVHRYHIFLIHSSVDGHLAGFHISAIVNNAAVDTGLHVLIFYLSELVFSFSLDVYLGVKLLDQKVVLFLVFLRNTLLFSIMAVPIYIPTNTHICCCWSFWWQPFWQCEEPSHCDSDLHFPDD